MESAPLHAAIIATCYLLMYELCVKTKDDDDVDDDDDDLSVTLSEPSYGRYLYARL